MSWSLFIYLVVAAIVLVWIARDVRNEPMASKVFIRCVAIVLAVLWPVVAIAGSVIVSWWLFRDWREGKL